MTSTFNHTSVQTSTAATNNEYGRVRSVRQMIRAGVELLAHDIETGHPEVLSDCLKTMARFPEYSFGNCLLIATQFPSARQVCGWRGWQELGRRVKQGEKGIMIFAPILSEPKSMKGESETQQQPQLLGFKTVKVFDYSQTDGADELPESNRWVNTDLLSILKNLIEFAASQEVQIEYSAKIAPARGTSYRGVIRLLPEMEAAETVSVLVRELAVQMLYQTQRRSFVTREVLLKEAQAVVFVVRHALGLESEPDNGIQLYQGNINLLAESLEVVKRTAGIILGALSSGDGAAAQGGN